MAFFIVPTVKTSNLTTKVTNSKNINKKCQVKLQKNLTDATPSVLKENPFVGPCFHWFAHNSSSLSCITWCFSFFANFFFGNKCNRLS
jgi:hypothetical protein